MDDEELIKKFAPFIHPNIWPTEHVPQMEVCVPQPTVQPRCSVLDAMLGVDVHLMLMLAW